MIRPTARFLAVPILALCLAGCKPAGVTGQPAPPTQGYQQAAQAMSNFATDLQQVQQVEINLHNGGVIDKPTHNSIQAAIKQVELYGKQGDSLIAAQASATTIRAKLTSALDAVASITVQTGKLDPNTAAQLTNAITAIKLLLNNVLDALPNPVSEVIYGPNHNRYAC